MTIEEAIEIVRQKWDDNDGCRSCGWKSAIAEFEPLEQFIDDTDIAAGVVELPCLSEADDDDSHRGVRVYLK